MMVSGVCLFTSRVTDEGVERSNPRPGIDGVVGRGCGLADVDGLGEFDGDGEADGLTPTLGLALGEAEGVASTALAEFDTKSSTKTAGIVRKTFQFKGLG